jgi:tRNA threonylcarbamoyladenosine biosynthesis protein TsaB
MNNILAFELADFRLSIALLKEGKEIKEIRSESLYGQDAELLPEIERLLDQQKLTYQDLDLIATTKGPGSFTGLRVALAAAEGVSLASGKPAVAFNSLEWVAKQYLLSANRGDLQRGDAILVALESKRKDAYCQLFDMNADILKDPVMLLPHELSDYIEEKKVLCIGSGRDKFTGLSLYLPEHTMPTARDLCSFAKQQVAQFGVNAFPCEPFYLRMPDVTVAKSS